MQNKYKLLKMLNNNVILVMDMQNSQEAVLRGRGIGFAKKEGQVYEILPSQIEKSFVMFDHENKEEMLQFISSIDNDVLKVCFDIVDVAEQKLGSLNPRLRMALTDHIVFALDRIKNNQNFNNPFTDDIKLFYPNEYEVAEIAHQMLLDAFKIDISTDEIGFIAMHFSAARNNVEVKESVRSMRLINEIIKIIEKNLGYSIPHNFEYSRLLYHLRSAMERIAESKAIINPMLDVIRENFSESYAIATEIKHFLEQNEFVNIPDDEIGYMAIHINRFR